MKNRISVLLVIIVAPLLLIVCMSQIAESAKEGTLESDKALDFVLEDLKGESISFGNISRNKVTLLDFSTTWCPPCRAIVPVLKGLYEAHKAQGLQVIAVYLNEAKATVEAYATEHDIPYPVLLDTAGSTGSSYNVRGVPTIILVDKEGLIRYRGHRVPTDMIKSMIEE